MEITDIIGKGKAFEPPFCTDPDGMYIYDKSNQPMLELRDIKSLAAAAEEGIQAACRYLIDHFRDLTKMDETRQKSSPDSEN